MDLINKNRGSNLISDKKEDREKKMKWEEKMKENWKEIFELK